MFDSVEDVRRALEEQKYICKENIATVVYLAHKLEKPVLIEGPAGVGKTELAKVVAKALDMPLIRLQCYEGLDETKALYEWEYAKQLLYTQMLRDKIGEILQGADTLKAAADRIATQDDLFFSERFIVPRPLMQAITAERRTMLLIDEVDKSDPEFEAFLLEVLSDFTVSIPELGTIHARQRPLVFLTSNNAREMTDALKRRCLHLYIDFPEEATEIAILNARIPGMDEKLVAELVHLVQRLRTLDLKKTPSISETLDWARALLVLNTESLDQKLVEDTLNIILKHQGDIHKAQGELGKFLAQKAAEARAETPAVVPTPAAVKKSVLH